MRKWKKFLRYKTLQSTGLSHAACKLLGEGVAAIFGPGNPHTRDIVTSITAKYGVPQIIYTFRRIDDPPLPHTTVNVYPDSMKISEVSSSWR